MPLAHSHALVFVAKNSKRLSFGVNLESSLSIMSLVNSFKCAGFLCAGWSWLPSDATTLISLANSFTTSSLGSGLR